MRRQTCGGGRDALAIRDEFEERRLRGFLSLHDPRPGGAYRQHERCNRIADASHWIRSA